MLISEIKTCGLLEKRVISYNRQCNFNILEFATHLLANMFCV